jgi:two-component system cell cycle sensor histidine kinase/response regulator CckA
MCCQDFYSPGTGVFPRWTAEDEERAIEKKVKRYSLLQRFSLLSFAAFLLVGLALGGILASSLEKTIIDRSKNETARFVAAEFDRVFPGMDFSLPMTGPRYEDFQKGASHLKFDPSIKRIKVWNPDSVVVWSDERQLVGKQFPNDKELLEALNGTTSSELSTLVKEENRTERQYHRLLELYIPIRFEHEGKVKAVVEIYQDLEDLDADTSRQKRILWIAIFGGFTGIYFACFGIVWRASRRLTEQTQEIEKSEKRTRNQFHFLQVILDAIPAPIFYKDARGFFLGCNKAYEEYIDISKDRLVGKTVYDIVPKDLADIYRDADDALIRKGGRQVYETGMVPADGKRHDVIFSKATFPNSDGSLGGLVGTILDITDRKRAEEEIKVLAKFPSESPDPIMRISAGGTLHYINESGSGQLSEWNLQVGKIAPPLLRDAVSQALNDGSRKMLDLEYGESAYSFSVSPVRDAGYANLYGRNITERKHAEDEKEKLQAQLQQSQKMEAVGRLAGGVAHDFNNLLTVITGYSELLLQKIGNESPMHKEVEEIKRAGERAALLTQQLLAFSRKQIIEPKVLDLNFLTSDLGKMLIRLIGENIDLKIVHGKNLGPVKVDPGQFDQVLINLAVNARDAMPDGGTLLIETANVELDEEYCAQRRYQILPGQYVRLAVSDTGHGMAEETRQQIFEPFFTTKEKGKGTGLGLSMVYGAVKQSGGSIEVYSEVGKGTTFKIYLPRVEGDAVKPGEDERPAVLPGGTETVLVTEDDEIVRAMCSRILGDLGYKVLQARNGAEGIATAQKYGDPIDLLLTDVVMPGMNGSELATQLVLHHPEMKVLFTSGYTDDAISRHGVLDEGVSFIGKPYTPLALARKAREVLDRA